jgi:hypothetical protein
MLSASAILCCHLWAVWFCNTLTHCLTNGTTFGKKKLFNINRVWLSLQLLTKTFLILLLIQPAIIINARQSPCQLPVTPYSCQILMQLEFSRQIFEKYSNIQFHEIPPPQWEQTCRRTDGQTGMTKLTVGFRNFAKAPNKT